MNLASLWTYSGDKKGNTNDIALDPWPTGGWKSLALSNIERAGGGWRKKINYFVVVLNGSTQFPIFRDPEKIFFKSRKDVIIFECCQEWNWPQAFGLVTPSFCELRVKTSKEPWSRSTPADRACQNEVSSCIQNPPTITSHPHLSLHGQEVNQNKPCITDSPCFCNWSGMVRCKYLTQIYFISQHNPPFRYLAFSWTTKIFLLQNGLQLGCSVLLPQPFYPLSAKSR